MESCLRIRHDRGRMPSDHLAQQHAARSWKMLTTGALTDHPRRACQKCGRPAEDIHLLKPRLHDVRTNAADETHEPKQNAGIVVAARRERMQRCAGRLEKWQV